MLAFNSRINQALEQRKAQSLSRSLLNIEDGNRTFLIHDGDSYLNFSSNDYLGLASDKELTQAWQTGLDRFGNGSGASPLVTGHSSAHSELEETLCDWLGFERAILFNSGFSANQAMLFSLLEKDDLLLQDKLNHASLIEAGMLSSARMKRFRHNDVEHLAASIQGNTLVVTEGVFSMDGDLAPLGEIDSVVTGKAWLAVDDAHGIGVLANDGSGSCAYAGIRPDLLVVTFGKAFGLSGAAILCSSEVGDYLTQFARHHVYSTAMPPAQAVALNTAAKMIQQQTWRRDKLLELSHHYHALLSGELGYCETQTPIKPFILGSSDRAIEVANQLKSNGLWVTAIRPPTVAKGSARLRITLTAGHEKAHLTKFAEQLKAALKGVE
ncbi:8-amino-7-oxononanoate synthase [Vibrio brasiliensis]|uniref:8-amino-7-ketopelargonate synthase n=1 Tax=Vibrio brasiliensis LMG 20546 TaxID=945543 RepID=E8LZA6_9VIBR|nr:8-amino-7-oxononanoate synthase [Vibrio brasiliensis]EGA63925.1 8-amino-7-oxononanoate synthase [Vibrio brasiliensis LMG 20546]